MLVAFDFGPLSGWLTVGSILVAAATFAAARRDLARQQASKVFGVPPPDQSEPLGAGDVPDVGDKVRWVPVSNLSDGPVFNVYAYVFAPGGHPRRLWRLHAPSHWMKAPLVVATEAPTSLDAHSQSTMAFSKWRFEGNDSRTPFWRHGWYEPPAAFDLRVVVNFRDGNVGNGSAGTTAGCRMG